MICDYMYINYWMCVTFSFTIEDIFVLVENTFVHAENIFVLAEDSFCVLIECIFGPAEDIFVPIVIYVPDFSTHYTYLRLRAQQAIAAILNVHVSVYMSVYTGTSNFVDNY